MQTTPMTKQQLVDLIAKTKKLKILYVEDDEETRRYTLKMLKNFFEDISVSENGEEGLDKCKNDSFDIVFTDINMPKMNGIEMIEKIRSTTATCRIVILSAHDEIEYFITSIKAGVDGYILKPFDYALIEETISNILDKILKYKSRIYLAHAFSWDPFHRVLYKDDKAIKLTKNERSLFDLLLAKGKNTYTSAEIESHIFENYTSDTSRVRNLLSRLKHKLEYELVESIYGEGYRLKR